MLLEYKAHRFVIDMLTEFDYSCQTACKKDLRSYSFAGNALRLVHRQIDYDIYSNTKT